MFTISFWNLRNVGKEKRLAFYIFWNYKSEYISRSILLQESFATSWFWGFLKEFLEDFVTSWFFGLVWKQYFVSFYFQDLVKSFLFYVRVCNNLGILVKKLDLDAKLHCLKAIWKSRHWQLGISIGISIHI